MLLRKLVLFMLLLALELPRALLNFMKRSLP